MNRSEYFSQTKEQFNSSAIESSFFPNHFDPLIGVYRVLEIIVDEGQYHPRFPGVHFVIKCKCIWKANLKDDFLEEFNHWFDLTGLLKDWEKLPELTSNFTWDYDSKAQVFHSGSQWRDIQVTDTEPRTWKFISKINTVIASDERDGNPKIIFGDKLLPLPENPESSAKIYKFSKDPIEYSSGLYPLDAEIIEVTDDNMEEILNNDLGPSLYFTTLNAFRNQYKSQLADTVPVKGYYKIYGIKIIPPRDYITRINGIETIGPAPWDLPYQIIGIGHWLGPQLPDDAPLKFNREYSVEIRLNPLFNRIADIEGLAPDFPRVKELSTFHKIATNGIFKINSIELEGNSYMIDWKVVYHNDYVKKTGF
jgi:hypothetical protein